MLPPVSLTSGQVTKIFLHYLPVPAALRKSSPGWLTVLPCVSLTSGQSQLQYACFSWSSNSATSSSASTHRTPPSP